MPLKIVEATISYPPEDIGVWDRSVLPIPSEPVVMSPVVIVLPVESIILIFTCMLPRGVSRASGCLENVIAHTRVGFSGLYG